jgi:hypothetical protein
MGMTPFRQHVAIAVDGGGIKGLMVARALRRLEAELGGGPLIDHPAIEVLAGTSTGAIITAGIALGLRMDEIADLYERIGQVLFKPLLPAYLPRSLHLAYRLFLTFTRPSLYTADGLIATFKQFAGDQTLGDLNDALKRRPGPPKALVLTTVDIKNRRTKFLKSYAPQDADWKLYEAVLASAAAPTYLPVFRRTEDAPNIRYFADGGIGNYNNPGYIAAREIALWKRYAPKDISVLSFGVGWLQPVNFEDTFGSPSNWRAVDWAKNGVMLLIGDAARGQSLNIIDDYVSQGMDFRRFQIALQKDIPIDSAAPAVLAQLKALGDVLGERLINDQHALSGKEWDPEGLQDLLDRYRQSLSETTEVTPAAIRAATQGGSQDV